MMSHADSEISHRLDDYESRSISSLETFKKSVKSGILSGKKKLPKIPKRIVKQTTREFSESMPVLEREPRNFYLANIDLGGGYAESEYKHGEAPIESNDYRTNPFMSLKRSSLEGKTEVDVIDNEANNGSLFDDGSGERSKTLPHSIINDDSLSTTFSRGALRTPPEIRQEYYKQEMAAIRQQEAENVIGTATFDRSIALDSSVYGLDEDDGSYYGTNIHLGEDSTSLSMGDMDAHPNSNPAMLSGGPFNASTLTYNTAGEWSQQLISSQIFSPIKRLNDKQKHAQELDRELHSHQKASLRGFTTEQDDKKVDETVQRLKVVKQMRAQVNMRRMRSERQKHHDHAQQLVNMKFGDSSRSLKAALKEKEKMTKADGKFDHPREKEVQHVSGGDSQGGSRASSSEKKSFNKVYRRGDDITNVTAPSSRQGSRQRSRGSSRGERQFGSVLGMDSDDHSLDPDREKVALKLEQEKGGDVSLYDEFDVSHKEQLKPGSSGVLLYRSDSKHSGGIGKSEEDFSDAYDERHKTTITGKPEDDASEIIHMSQTQHGVSEMDEALMLEEKGAHHGDPTLIKTGTPQIRLRNDQSLAVHKDSYIGDGAKEHYLQVLRNADRDLRVMPVAGMIPEEMRTPRRMYVRATRLARLIPLPLVLRQEKHCRGIYLGHKGLGDTKILPLVSVMDELPCLETADLCDNRLTDKSLGPLLTKLINMSSLLHLDLSFNDMDDSSRTIRDYVASPDCYLQTLLLNGSDVDDYECCHLCDAMCKNTSIKTLGLANNLIGENEYRKVTAPDLYLGGDAIASMIEQNTTLTSLDVTYNKIRLKGAAAIGKAFTKNRSIKYLKAGYNSFGDLGTQWLGYALKHNSTVVYVDLQANSLVPKSVCVLTNALAYNETLTHLVLDDNVLGRVGSQAVTAAIQRSSQAARKYKLEISFNQCDCFKYDPAVFDPAKPGGKHKLDMTEPYGQMILEECMFLANHRAGCEIKKLEYQLGRDKKVIELERVQQADTKEAFNIDIFHKSSKAAAKNLLKGNVSEASNMLQKVLKQFHFVMDTATCREVVRRVETNWSVKQSQKNRSDDLHEVYLMEVFSALFMINDADESNTMDVDEFLQTLSSLGMYTVDKHQLLTFMAEYDRDMSGTIDGAEFSMIMVHEFCRTDVPRGLVCDKTTKKPYPTPDEGVVTVDVQFEIDSPSALDVADDEGVTTLINGIIHAQTGEQKDVLFTQACSSPYFFLTSNQAQRLFDDSTSAGLAKLPLDMIIALMPQIVNEEQVNRFLDQNLSDEGKLALRVRMGPLYNAFVGLGTGHYFIDFSVPLHNMGSKRLAGLSVSETKATTAVGANTSQKGNGTNFRNEMFGKVNKATHLPVDGQWFANAPEHGELRLDYVSTRRPLVGTTPISDARFKRLLTRLDFSSIILYDTELKRLQTEREREKERQKETFAKELTGAKKSHNAHRQHGSRIPKKKKAQSVSEETTIEGGNENADAGEGEMLAEDEGGDDENLDKNEEEDMEEDDFGDEVGDPADPADVSLDEASLASFDSMESLEKLASTNGGNLEQKLAAANARKIMQSEEMLRLRNTEEAILEKLKPRAPLSHTKVKEQFVETMLSSYHYTDIFPQERMRDVSRMNYNSDPDFKPDTPRLLSHGLEELPSRRKMPRIYPLAYRKLLELQVIMPTIYFDVSQLAEMMQYFPEDGYLRVQLILSVFSHITDVENLGLVYDTLLSPDERYELMHRLGPLNIFDPMHPDREYRLDLRRWDHREMCKILVHLSITEPGENWVDGGEYRWSKYDDPVPGWVIPAKWAAKDESEGGSRDNGPRREGWVRVSYTSTAEGCKEDMALRRHLRRKTLSGLKQLL